MNQSLPPAFWRVIWYLQNCGQTILWIRENKNILCGEAKYMQSIIYTHLWRKLRNSKDINQRRNNQWHMWRSPMPCEILVAISVVNCIVLVSEINANFSSMRWLSNSQAMQISLVLSWNWSQSIQYCPRDVQNASFSSMTYNTNDTSPTGLERKYSKQT